MVQYIDDDTSKYIDDDTSKLFTQLESVFFIKYVCVPSAMFSGNIRRPTSNTFVSMGEHLLIRLSVRRRPM